MLFCQTEKTDAAHGARYSARQHGRDVVPGTPGKFVGRARVAVERLGKRQRGRGTRIDPCLSFRVHQGSSKRVEGRMTRDVSLETRGQRQTTRNAHLVANPLSTAVQAPVSERTVGHTRPLPAIFEVKQWSRNPRIGKSKMLFGLGVDRRFESDLRNRTVLAGNRLIDFSVVDCVVLEFRRWPGKNE